MNTHKYHAGGVTFSDSPIMIGAGACKTPAETKRWLEVAPVVSGSYTPEEQTGNEGKLFFPETEEEFYKNSFGLNSFGMPNVGFDASAQKFPFTQSANHAIASIAGFSAEDYLRGTSTFNGLCSAIEENLGCPNTEHGKFISFDLVFLDTLFGRLAEQNDLLPVWAKFSPYSDPGLLKEVASIVNCHKKVVRAVVTCNTFPNAFAGKGNISPNNGLAGLSGPAMKPIALGQVCQFRQRLDSEVDVIGVGGITTGNDVVDFLDAGAKAVQLTSMPFWSGNPGTFWETLLNPETGSRLETYLTNNA